VYSLGISKAFVSLNPTDERVFNLRHIYIPAVAACIALQLAIYALMLGVMRPGNKVFRLGEDEKMAQFCRIHGAETADFVSKWTTKVTTRGDSVPEKGTSSKPLLPVQVVTSSLSSRQPSPI
jgi:hypothetical protein